MTKEQINLFCETLKNEVKNNSLYVWGGQGQKFKDLTVEKLCKMETSALNARRVVECAYNKKITDETKIFDCSGLVTWTLINMGVLKSDTTADGILKKCKKVTGKVKKGDFVFKTSSDGKAYHIGTLTDVEHVTEAKGRDFGVVTNTFVPSEWDIIARLK